MQAVLVLNADLGPLHRVSLRHAIRMLCRGVAEIHEAEPDIRFGIWNRPTVVRLIQYVVTKWRYSAGPSWSRNGVLRRDGFRCGYCDSQHGVTVDHILPTSRGGKNTWANTIACCDPCNQRKENKTPEEAGMKLRFKPSTPTWATLHR
jgi:5-methylcytosine-specific restriction endonuclease McrA